MIAADARVGEEDLGRYVTVADRVLRYEHIGANRHWSWLAEQARGDWLLIMDGDELPGTDLVAALPELVADRRIDQYWLPIHWPWPDAATRLAGEPWGSDRRIRLLRNDGSAFFEGRMHSLAREAPPLRHLDELPVFHLDLLLNDTDTRRAKVVRYDAARFGLLTPEGEPVNRAFYLPEDQSDLSLAPIAAADRRRIEGALERPDPASSPEPPAAVSLHPAREIAWHWAGRTLPPEAYRAELSFAGPLPPFAAGGRGHRLTVRVANSGTARWPGGEDRPPLIRLGLRWRAQRDGALLDAGRAMLPHAIDPGEEALVPFNVDGPPTADDHDLVVDLIHEQVRWFDAAAVAAVAVAPATADRLASLAVGGVVPVQALRDLRASLGRPDALYNDTEADAAAPNRPTDPGLAALTEGHTLRGWALDAAAIDRLAECVRAERPAYVAEFGSGISTLVLAHLLAELHGHRRRRLICIEDDSFWAHNTRAALAHHGLADLVGIVQVPLSDPQPPAPSCYALTNEARRELRSRPPDLVLVDGPAPATGGSPLGVPDLVGPFAAPGAALLLARALRDAELCVAKAWAERDEIEVHGVRPVGTGLLEATLSVTPPRARAGRLRRLVRLSR